MVGMEQTSLIEWICVRAPHRTITPVDPSTPISLHEDGRWAYCPAGLSAEADHLWYATGGVTRAALARFRWPSEDEVSRGGEASRD